MLTGDRSRDSSWKYLRFSELEIGRSLYKSLLPSTEQDVGMRLCRLNQWLTLNTILWWTAFSGLLIMAFPYCLSYIYIYTIVV